MFVFYDGAKSSISLYNSSSIFAASQYGAIWYTHELGSTIVNGSSNKTFVETVKSQCVTYANLGLNYTTAEDCDRFRGLGYVIQYNFTGLHTSPLYQTLADQALVRYATNNPEFTITTTIAPLPITKSEEGYGQAEDVFLVWLLVRCHCRSGRTLLTP